MTEKALSQQSKQDLIATIGKLTERLEVAAIKADPGPQPPKPKPIAEAVALRDCIRALDEVVRDGRAQHGSGNYGMVSTYSSGSDAIERVLRHLAAKYGVRLVETVWREDCPRPHVDQIDAMQLQQALGAAVSS